MRITNVRACQPVAPEAPRDWRTTLGQILVAIETDVGLTGYGVGGGGLAGVHVARTVLRDVLLHEDPEKIENLWDSMNRATMPFGRKGIAVMAMSGVDLALWDLRGKGERQPVVSLLGGRTGTAIPTYATVWDDVDTVIGKGYQAIKLHIEHRADRSAVDWVAHTASRTREQVGPDCQLMIDAWMRWDVETTLAVADVIANENVVWIEEPLPPDDEEGYERLAQSCPTPIAGGEHEFTYVGFRHLIDRRLHQILQPDVCWCGGLTQLIRIYEHAQRVGLRVCPHRGAELWGLHAIAALDHQPLAETGRPWMTWVPGQPAVIEGSITLGESPGFGAEIDECNLKVL